MFGCSQSQDLELIKRFTKNDSTLSNKEILSLLIEFSKTDSYQPFELMVDEKIILREINEKNDLKSAKIKSKLLIENQPYNLIANMGINLYEQIENNKNEYYSNSKYEKLINAILFSGNGSLEKPFFILSPLDKEIILRLVIPHKSYNRKDIGIDDSNTFDVIEIESKGSKRNYYFNVKHMFN